MVESLYVTSTQDLSGKTLMVLALALEAEKQGKRVGYFKPIGTGSSLTEKEDLVDEDVATMREILGLEEGMDLLCPVVLSSTDVLDDCLKKNMNELSEDIRESYQEVSAGKDIVFIEGTDTVWTGSFLGLSAPKIASQLSSRILLVSTAKGVHAMDDVIHARDFCRQHDIEMAGTVLNRVPRDRLERTIKQVKPCLQSHGVDVLGVIPEDKELSALTVREICDALGGKVLAGEDGMDRAIKNYVIGAMTMESAMKYFRRATDKLVITGGDRTDIILAAMEAGASALILTGNLYPTIKIMPRADDKGIPIIMVPQDTYGTLNLVQKTIGKVKPGDKRRIDKARQLFGQHVDLEALIHS